MARDKGAETDGLTEEQGKALLWLARKTITQQLGIPAQEADAVIAASLQTPTLHLRRGTFVTLKKHGELRGCIGNLAAVDSIMDGVKRNALHAAFNDVRFNPVGENELTTIKMEISILTEPVPLTYTKANELISALQPGSSGVIIRKGGQSATFLPQVWEQLPKADDFLSHLCQKAGLSPNAWQSENLEVFTYQVQPFAEPD